jgi:two-component system cell cycle response regulator
MSKHSALATGQPSRGKVLVVDDSRLVRTIVKGILKSGGFDIEEAEGGARALELLAKGAYDVVITDLRMPDLDGFGVLSGVKRVAPHVEVIILTGTHAEDLSCAVRALRLGAHDYLSKPPSSRDEVLATVDRAVEKKRLKDANQRLQSELEALSRRDPLTGVLNRRALEEALGQETARAHRHGHALAMVMLDIDHFKRVNDTHGHPAGDQVLRSFAKVTSSVLREGDVLFRYGGEEFAVMLPHTGLEGALNAARRILCAVAATPFDVAGSVLNITASAGVACLASAGDGAELIAAADAALYAAKNSGRNRAVASGPRPARVAARVA